MITVEQLQKKYEEQIPTDCCVGGALCLELRDLLPSYMYWNLRYLSFPGQDLLSHVLQIANPALNNKSSLRRAKGIMLANDQGRIAVAWDRLDAALTYRSES